MYKIKFMLDMINNIINMCIYITCLTGEKKTWINMNHLGNKLKIYIYKCRWLFDYIKTYDVSGEFH